MTGALLVRNVAPRAGRGPRRRLVRDGALRVVFIAFSVLFAGTSQWARAEDAATSIAATERGVKAAFLYKFAAYVDWPPTAFAQPDAPLVIGVTGADDIAAELQQVTVGRTINDRPIVVRRLRESETLAGLHILFIGRGEAGRIGAIARNAQQRSILTVTDTPNALESGSVINFIIVEGRVRFEISLDAAERSGLKLSSRLLAVAQLVRQNP